MPALHMNRRVVILGFMACGKTTVGQELARRLDCGFIDLDSFITEQEHRSPAQIITDDGEESFRHIETLALGEVLQARDVCVIALGGGTWTIPANRTLVALHDCLSVWLDTAFEVCWGRIEKSQTPRPLALNREAAKSRYKARRSDYVLAQQRVTIAESDTPETIADQILREM